MSKLVALEEGAQLIKDGDILALGGNTIHRCPAGFARELARQGRKNLTLVKTAGAYDVDLLSLAGCLSTVHGGYIGFENLGMAVNYRKRVEAGEITASEHACYTVIAALRAAAFGIPFQPLHGLQGSDLVEARAFKMVQDPYTGAEVVAIPRISPDWTVLHVDQSDIEGNALIEGPAYEDILMSRSAKGVIITAEEIIPTASLGNRHPGALIPGFLVKAVIHFPGGALPCGCYPRYQPDVPALKSYLKLEKSNLPDYLKEVR